MNKSKTVCFTGHRPQSLPFGFNETDERCQYLKEQLKEMIMDLIESKNVTRFISGMALGVDMYAAQIVLDIMGQYPNITLECALPCGTQSGRWNAHQQERYYDILKNCDKITLLQAAYTRDCMHKRNRYMVDNADFVIAVWNGKPSGTGKTVQYAMQQGKEILVIPIPIK